MNKRKIGFLKISEDNYKFIWLLIIAALIAFITAIVYFTGGASSTVQLFYIPIFITIFKFGIKGGLIAAIVSGLAVGPFMPYAATNSSQPTAMWILRIVMSIIIVLVVGVLFERNKRLSDLEKKKAYEDISTGYFNSNKFKADLRKLVSEEACSAITIIIFDFQNMDMIKRYVDIKTSKKCFLQLLNMANEFFHEGTIYVISDNKFTVMLPNIYIEETYILAKKFIQNTKNPIYINELPISMVIKGGIVNYPLHETNIGGIILMLDKAIDQSLRSQSELVIYDNIIDKEHERYYQDIVSLFHALQNDKFTLVYQPKIDIQNNKVVGVEALIRWNDENHNNMSICELIRRAEDAGFINQITKWVIRNVAEQLKIWREKGMDVSVSINLSSRDLSDETFIEYVDEYITNNEINPDSIEFELTERSIIHNEDFATEELNKLKSIGIKLSLDDYGTGYNSLKYMLGFAGVFDYLKIDKIFIDNILKDESFIIVECIIKFAHSLDMKVIAEGVETIEQVELLKGMGCDIVQGYYYSKPLSPVELEQLMQEAMTNHDDITCIIDDSAAIN